MCFLKHVKMYLLKNIFVRLDGTCLILLFCHSVKRINMFGLQTMFDRVWSPKVSRLDRAKYSELNLSPYWYSDILSIFLRLHQSQSEMRYKTIPVPKEGKRQFVTYVQGLGDMKKQMESQKGAMVILHGYLGQLVLSLFVAIYY